MVVFVVLVVLLVVGAVGAAAYAIARDGYRAAASLEGYDSRRPSH